MKMLPQKVLDELPEINKARESVGMKPLVPKVVRCLLCLQDFQSLGQRNCGCDNDGVLKKLESQFNPRGKL